jgi:predicted DNA-binding ribbon-helix-helix protein
MKSLVVKRSIVIDGQKTSVSLEDAFWESLREVAQQRGDSLSRLVTGIDASRQSANLSSALRYLFLGFTRINLFSEAKRLSSRKSLFSKAAGSASDRFANFWSEVVEARKGPCPTQAGTEKNLPVAVGPSRSPVSYPPKMVARGC